MPKVLFVYYTFTKQAQKATDDMDTDAEREYAYEKDPILGSGTEQLLSVAAGGAWTVIDMATDWSTIYATE